jgi:dipeptidyl aminopeptidase/acylaminoacyl peptidase
VAGLLPELEIEIVDESWDQTRYLARARPVNGTGELLLVDMQTQSIEPIGPEYEHLTGYPLAETRRIEIESSTGGTLTAHLTLPHNVAWPEPASPVPAVIMPRAQASHENVADPNYLVQFFAANGYAVLRVQNRVEPEYGQGWLPERAVVGWRQSAADVRDAADYLVANGITSADTICAAGKDFGAYTALMSALEYPENFRCVVSIAGVTDPRATEGAPVIIAGVTSDADNVLDAASPLRRADELEVPLLMFHGRNDPEIDFTEHAISLSRVLEREDKDVAFIEYRQALHDIARGPDRIDMLTRIRGFLAEQIGPVLRDEESVVANSRWRP